MTLSVATGGLQESGSFNSTLVFQVFLVTVVVGALFLIVRSSRKTLPPSGLHLPPTYKTGAPLVGNFVAFARDPLGCIRKARKELGDVFTIDFIAEKCTFLIGQSAHIAFFEATDEELDQAPVYQFMTPIFGKGVIYDSPLAKRRQQMRALGAILKPSMLRSYCSIIAEETHNYLKSRWGESGQIDLLPSLAELIILTASATLLGPEIRNELFLEVSHLYEMLDKGLTPLSIFFPYAPISAHFKRDKARKEMVSLFSKVIQRRRSDLEKAKDNIDILQRLMEFKYKDGSSLTNDEITGLLIATLFAGQHTSSITTTWTLLYLLEDLRNKSGGFFNGVMEEIKTLEPSPGDFASGKGIDSSVLSNETNLYNAIKEAIRLHPPLILLMRRAVKPITTATGHYIPEGHRVIVSNAVAQRLPEVFTDPDSFNPGRWLDFDISKLPKYSFIGFGAGIHTCMGEPFAFLQIRTILTVMLSMYDMELTTPFPQPNYEAMVVPPKGPNMVKYKLRTPEKTAKTGAPKEKPLSVQQSVRSKSINETLERYSLEEIKKHNKRGDLWLIVDGGVYDVSNYLDLHQGGDNAILKWGGKDATAAVAGPQHPGTVPTLLERFLIGYVKS